MDPVASGPAGTWTPGEPAGATAFSPGQVLSARVIQALAGDTYLVAVRGLQLVAQSPQSLALDSVVKLAVQGGGAGEPLRVQLVSGAGMPVPSGPQPAAPAELARQLGLPPGPVANLVIAAFQEQGAALGLPALRQAVRLVGQAQAQVPAADLAARVQSEVTADLLAAVQPDARNPLADEPVLAVPPRPVTITPSMLAATPVPIRSNPGDLAALMPRTTAVPEPLAESASRPIAVAVSSPAPPPAGSPPAPSLVVGQAPAPVTTGEERAPAALRGDNGEPAGARAAGAPTSAPAAGRAAPLMSGPLPRGVPSVASVVVTPVRSGEAARIYRQQPSTGESLALRATVQHAPPAAVASALARLAASPVPVTPLTVPLALTAGRPGLPTIAMHLSASTPDAGSPLVHETGETTEPGRTFARRTPTPASLSLVPAEVGHLPRAAVQQSEVSARPLAAAARLPLINVEATPARVAPQVRIPLETSVSEQRPLREQDARKPAAPTPTSIPSRDLVDLARQPPREAAEAALRLAGLVPHGGSQALTVDLGSLLRRLVVLATLPGAAAAGASSASQSTSSPASPGAYESQPLARVGLAALPVAESETAAAPTAGPSAPDAPPTNSTPTTMLRDAVAQDVLPPKELADYDRVLALPLAVQGQPVPARLAVSTRRTADGGLACWMRVDCELSQLGPLSVRLGGADAGPVAITLVTTPAAGPTIAEAITALSDDLRAAGIDAALRVVVDAGSGA